MTFRLLTLAMALACSTSVMGQERVMRQEPGKVAENVAAVSSPSDLRSVPTTAKELRIARAQYRAQQRAARIEYNLWMGYEPLRPKWNSLPMMSSRFPPPRIQVPVYVPAY